MLACVEQEKVVHFFGYTKNASFNKVTQQIFSLELKVYFNFNQVCYFRGENLVGRSDRGTGPLVPDIKH